MGKIQNFSLNEIFPKFFSYHMCTYMAILSVKYLSIPRSGCRMGLEAVVEIRVCFYSFAPLVPALDLLLNICVLSVTVG